MTDKWPVSDRQVTSCRQPILTIWGSVPGVFSQNKKRSTGRKIKWKVYIHVSKILHDLCFFTVGTFRNNTPLSVNLLVRCGHIKYIEPVVYVIINVSRFKGEPTFRDFFMLSHMPSHYGLNRGTGTDRKSEDGQTAAHKRTFKLLGIKPKNSQLIFATTKGFFSRGSPVTTVLMSQKGVTLVMNRRKQA